MFTNTSRILDLNRKFSDAVLAKNVQAVEALFEQEETPDINHEILTAPAILIAAQHADWDMVKVLYNLNADLEAATYPLKWYLIHECITEAPERVTNAIIEYCNVNAQTAKGETPLMVAIKRGKYSTAEYLVNTDRLDLSLVNKEQENAAHYAARTAQYDLLLKLIEKGIPILKKNKSGHTPIDLIEDEAFKNSLPQQFEKIAAAGNTVVLEKKGEQADLADKTEEAPKKVSGLSSIKKKVS